MDGHRRKRVSVFPWVTLFVLGVALFVLTDALIYFHVGDFGQPANIGGGFPFLIAIVMMGAGVLGTVVALVTRRRGERDQDS